jgi:chemotaxis-related protein WspB
MLALGFHVGELRLALPVHFVVEVLARRALRPLALAPAGVVGLLPFRGTLTPVVDLCQLMLGRPCRALRSSRLIIVALDADAGVEPEAAPRLLGLLAENVLDLMPTGDTLAGLRLPEAPWLGDHLSDQHDMPQLIDPAQLLPAELAALFTRQAPV